MRRRALLVLAVAALAALGALTIGGQGGAELAPVTAAAAEGLTPPGCTQLTPEQANTADQRCRDYLFQVRCQFSPSTAVEETWESWCEQNKGLEEGAQAEVPRCNLELAGQATEVGMRCRDYLAKTHCFAGHSSEQSMQEFCAKVAPSAGPDPRPRACTTALAHDPSQEGNECWAQLEREHCQNWSTGKTTGAQDLDEFCTAVAAGAKPPTFDPQCDKRRALENSAAGHACREQLFQRECERRSQGTAEIEAFCQQVLAERSTETSPTPTRGAESTAPNPQQQQAEKPKPSAGAPNVLLQLGREPACRDRDELNPEVQRSCALTGSVMHSYPFSSYGIDNNVSISIVDGSFWSGEAPIMSLFQWLIVAVWQGLIWLVKAALLLLQWAFGVDPLSRSLDHVSGSVMALFNPIGPEWRLTALAVLGVWGFWNGLVRMRFTQTLAGLALSMLMMVGAMWIVYDPKGTVGEVAHYANESAVTILSATSTGELRRPGEGMAEGQRTVFDQMVVGPWCALEFGGLEACNKPTGDGKLNRAELWLSLPANSSARGILYKATKEGPDAIKGETDENVLGDFFDAIGDKLCFWSAGLIDTCKNLPDVFKTQTQEDRENNPEKARQFDEAKAQAAKLVQKDPAAVSLQGTEGVFTRAGLLAVIAIGIVGAVAFLIMIGIRLLMAGVIILLLILLAPVMLVVAAFGEAGRRRFLTWLQMLLGATVAKLVYAVLLGLVLLVAGILHDINLAPVAGTGDPAPAGPATAGAGSADWLGSWVLISTFFWVAVLNLNRILALISPDPASEHGSGVGAAAALYAGQRLVSQSLRGAWEGARLPMRVAPRVGRLARRQRDIGRQSTERAIRGQADKQLRERALGMARHEHGELSKRARGILDAKRSGAVRERISRLDQNLKRKSLTPTRREGLQRQRGEAERALWRAEADEGWARSWVQRQGSGSHEPSEATLQERISRRKRDVAQWGEDANSWSSESNRRWAEISDEEWRKATRAETLGNSKPMEALRHRSEAALGRDRDLLARADTSKLMSRQTSRGARREWGGGTMFDRLRRTPGLGRDPEFAARRKEARRELRRSGRENLRRRP